MRCYLLFYAALEIILRRQIDVENSRANSTHLTSCCTVARFSLPFLNGLSGCFCGWRHESLHAHGEPQCCIKKMAKKNTRLWLLRSDRDRPLSQEPTQGALEDRADYRPSFFPCGKAGELHILRCQGLATDDYGFTLGALTLKPSDFCNVGVNVAAAIHHHC
jgi:hypothetical protein